MPIRTDSDFPMPQDLIEPPHPQETNPNPNPIPSIQNPFTSPSDSPPSPPDSPPSPQPNLLHLSFNQDHGFRIFNCDPFREIFRRDFISLSTNSAAEESGGGISAVEMLFRCNIMALIGGRPHPQYLTNNVMIWDNHQSRCIGELSFQSNVRSVRLRRDRIIVVLEQQVYVYNFTDLKLLHQIETIAN